MPRTIGPRAAHLHLSSAISHLARPRAHPLLSQFLALSGPHHRAPRGPASPSRESRAGSAAAAAAAGFFSGNAERRAAALQPADRFKNTSGARARAAVWRSAQLSCGQIGRRGEKADLCPPVQLALSPPRAAATSSPRQSARMKTYMAGRAIEHSDLGCSRPCRWRPRGRCAPAAAEAPLSNPAASHLSAEFGRWPCQSASLSGHACSDKQSPYERGLRAGARGRAKRRARARLYSTERWAEGGGRLMHSSPYYSLLPTPSVGVLSAAGELHPPRRILRAWPPARFITYRPGPVHYARAWSAKNPARKLAAVPPRAARGSASATRPAIRAEREIITRPQLLFPRSSRCSRFSLPREPRRIIARASRCPRRLKPPRASLGQYYRTLVCSAALTLGSGRSLRTALSI